MLWRIYKLNGVYTDVTRNYNPDAKKIRQMNENESGLEQITDTIGDLVTGVPAPIRKNFFKAIGQLCTAAVDIPVAKMESTAAEIRAASAARVQIIKKEGESIAKDLNVPKEYIAKASEKFASKVVKEQLNLDQIVLNAANNLAQEDYSKEPSEPIKETKEISDDWLNEFENYAKLKSSEDMKLVFGKILSGEIKSPGSYSIRTLRLVSQLDNQAARIFQNLCSVAISLDIGTGIAYDARVVVLTGSAGSNSLSKYGLSFDNLNILQEYGLIISDYNSYFPYSPCVVNQSNQLAVGMRLGNKLFGLLPVDREKYDKELKLNGVSLTKAGKELLGIIPVNDNANYRKDFEEFLANKHLKLVEVGK